MAEGRLRDDKRLEGVAEALPREETEARRRGRDGKVNALNNGSGSGKVHGNGHGNGIGIGIGKGKGGDHRKSSVIGQGKGTSERTVGDSGMAWPGGVAADQRAPRNQRGPGHPAACRRPAGSFNTAQRRTHPPAASAARDATSAATAAAPAAERSPTWRGRWNPPWRSPWSEAQDQGWRGLGQRWRGCGRGRGRDARGRAADRPLRTAVERL